MRGIFNAFALKGSTVVLTFVLLTLAARMLGEHDFGTFSILFSAAGLLSIFATIGQQLLVMRSWSEHAAAGDAAGFKGAIRFNIALFSLGATLTTTGYFGALLLAYPPDLAAASALYMVLLGLMMTTAHLVRSAVGVGIGDGTGNLLTVIIPILYLLLCAAFGAGPDMRLLFLSFCIASLITITTHLIVMWRKVRDTFPDFARVAPRYELRTWLTRSLKLWLTDGLASANQYLDVLIVGLIMSPSIAGAYFVTTRLANAFATAADALYMFATRHIPDLYYRGEFKRLGQLLDSVAVITLVILAVGMVVVIAFGHWLLIAFNEAYAAYNGALVILCLGTAAVAGVGPAGALLVFTGHEGANLKITVLTVLIRVLGFFVLMPSFNVLGAATATTISFLFMAITMRNTAKSLTGIDGSVFRLLDRISKRETPKTAR